MRRGVSQVAAAHFDRRGGILVVLLIAASAVLLDVSPAFAVDPAPDPASTETAPTPDPAPAPDPAPTEPAPASSEPAPASSPSAPTNSSEIDTETSGAAASSSTQPSAAPPNRKHKKGTHRPRDEQDKGAALRAGWKWQGARNESFRVGATLPAVASEAVVVSATVSSASGSSPATFLRVAVLAAALAILLLAVTPTFALDASRVLRPVGEWRFELATIGLSILVGIAVAKGLPI